MMIAANATQRHLLEQRLSASALLQMVLDPIVAIGSLSAAVSAYGGRLDGAFFILSLIVFSLTFPSRVTGSFTTGRVIVHVLGTWLAVVGLLFLIGWATGTLELFDQRALAAWIAATPGLMLCAHLALPAVLPRVMSAEGVQRVAVIAGAGDLGQRLAQGIMSSTLLGIRFAGFFDDRKDDRLGTQQPGNLLGTLADLATYAKTHRVDLIYVTLPLASSPRIRKLLEELRDTTASIYFAPDIFVFDLIQARMDAIGGVPVVAVCETPFYGSAGILKRISDLVIASAILMLISPLMLCIAAGVKLSSPGPVLFKQRRYGLDGREIVVYKFRSMTVQEDGEVVKQATRNDQRVTRFGAFLRKTSLDELPQFINVLQGRMSVVGPRPHAVSHNEMYRKLIKGYMIRHKIRPGITGWAQVNGYRGETDTLEKMKGRIEYDLDYLRNWSLRLDLQIILKTVLVVLDRQNAY
jgi:putative colanic acid biosynthesis UDP-glucose lipid carrier transferase